MLSGEYRRSPRIVELDARKAQESRSQNMANVICEVMDVEELDKGQDILKQKRGRKKVKVRAVQDLVVNSVEYKDQKTDTGNDEDHLINAANVPSRAATPEKSKLELLLGILQRRDTHKIFAEPVNAEEVEFYYDVIKEPMDFGTIAKKLNEGSYQTLEEFEVCFQNGCLSICLITYFWAGEDFHVVPELRNQIAFSCFF
ncbi:bromodomain-containing protein 9-like [Durio zibethinus]|uniref:Bromodomain-containing protein 9-like n=1 Tax=Durio zibethinus TaxID=66656 RepID=A0A6P6AJC0_DURZI|nr:bromodomain-containing protein 9-like [Durio zibethinus]